MNTNTRINHKLVLSLRAKGWRLQSIARMLKCSTSRVCMICGPTKRTNPHPRAIRALRKAGATYREIAKQLRVSTTTVQKALAA